MWLMVNKKNAVTKLVNDAEKAEWLAGPYGKLFTFTKQQALPRAIPPEAVKTIAEKEQGITKKRTKKQPGQKA